MKAANNKGIDQTAWMCCFVGPIYGINRFSHDIAQMVIKP